MKAQLEDVAMEFLGQRLQGESIDDLFGRRPSAAHERADFLLFERSVVAEVKALVDDRQAGIRRILDSWRRMPGWPQVQQTEDIQVVLRNHPQGAEINRQLFESVLGSVEAKFRKANSQIRATKQAFMLPDALGLLVMLNHTVDVLEPTLLASMIGDLLNKKDKAGNPRYAAVEWVLYIDWAHEILEDGAPKGHAIMSCERPASDYPAGFDKVQLEVMQAWSGFLGLPLKDGGLITDGEDLKKIRVVGKRPPTVF